MWLGLAVAAGIDVILENNKRGVPQRGSKDDKRGHTQRETDAGVDRAAVRKCRQMRWIRWYLTTCEPNLVVPAALGR